MERNKFKWPVETNISVAGRRSPVSPSIGHVSLMGDRNTYSKTVGRKVVTRSPHLSAIK